MWYLANTIYSILLLQLFYIHPISTAEAPTRYSKYGPRSFLAYVADNLYYLYATGYSSCRLGFCSHLKTAISARFLYHRAKLSHADLESGSSHFDSFLCHLLARYEQMYILWYKIAFHADMISDQVLCLLSLKVAPEEEKTNHLRKILITLFSTTRQKRRPCWWTKQQNWNFHSIYMKKGFSFFCSCSKAWRL